MSVTALFLLLLGVVDVTRSALPDRRRLLWAVRALLMSAVVLITALAAAPHPFWSWLVPALPLAALAILWGHVGDIDDSPWRQRGLGAAALALAAVIVVDLRSGALERGWTAFDPGAAGESWSWPTLVTILAVLLFLGSSGNVITRTVLALARTRSAPPHERPADATDGPSLQGGRVIGPLERWLLLALVTVGQPAVAVAVLGAKGIVRFPEISKDRSDGHKAEEFLVGSLTSWTLAAIGAVVLRLAATGG